MNNGLNMRPAIKAGVGVVAAAVVAGGVYGYVHARRTTELETGAQESVADLAAQEADTENEEDLAARESASESTVQDTAAETAIGADTEVVAGPVLPEERVETIYQYVCENMETAENAVVAGDYHVINLAAPDAEYYGMAVGDYEADEGVYAVMRKDLDADGEEELLVFSRMLEESVDAAADDDSHWSFRIQVADMENDEISVSDAQEMLSLSNRSGPDGRTVTVYYKALDDGIEILCRDEGAWTLNADGTDDDVTAYRYQDGQLQHIDSAVFAGSDPWGIGDDQELLAALRNMGLVASADEIAQYTYDYQGYMGYSGLLSDAEEGITNVLHMELVTYLDRDAWWNYYNQHGSGSDSSVLEFDTSPYYANLELTIDDSDHAVYAAE